MSIGYVLVFLLISWIAWTQAPPMPMMLEETTGDGSLVVDPQTAISGEYGTWTVTYTVGEAGIQTGGGIRVQCADEWHAGPRNSASRLQTQEPVGNNYIAAYSSNAQVTLRAVVEMERENILIKHAKPSLDGRSERYVFVVRILIEQGTLQSGDTLSVVYGDTSGGSRGYRAAAVTGTVKVIAAVDGDGDNRFRRLADTAELTVLAGSAVEMMVHLPSQGRVGQPIQAIVSLVDQEANPIDHAVSIQLYAHSGEADFPERIEIPPYQGYAEFEFVPNVEGIYRLRARTQDFELEAISNPMRAFMEEPDWKLYWGDLHSHTHYSWDGVGTNSFDYARYVSGLDFYAMTDHAVFPSPGGITRGLSRKTWDEYTRLSNQYHVPNEFTTIIAYECSFGTPYGHHIVYFRDQPGVLDYPGRTTLPELWGKLQEGQGITIPHHTGKFPGKVDLGIHDERFRRNFELYSGHGLSEVYDPSHPLAFEHSVFTSDAKSQEYPSHYLDALRMGLQLSPLGASDDHRARPGQPHYGLAAVWAKANTREALFEGLYHRQTYAVTGQKIVFEFRIDGEPAWEYSSDDETPSFHITAHGTDEIEWVELLRFQPDEDEFKVIQRWEVDAWDFGARYVDAGYSQDAVYYCRLKQKRWVRNRPVYAWLTYFPKSR